MQWISPPKWNNSASDEIADSQTNGAPINVNIEKSYSIEHQKMEQDKCNDGNEETPVFSEKEYLERESSTSKGKANETLKGSFRFVFTIQHILISDTFWTWQKWGNNYFFWSEFRFMVYVFVYWWKRGTDQISSGKEEFREI